MDLKHENVLKNIKQINELVRSLDHTKTQLMNSLRKEPIEILYYPSDFKWNIGYTKDGRTKLIGEANERVAVILELVNQAGQAIISNYQFKFNVGDEIQNLYPLIEPGYIIIYFDCCDRTALFKLVEGIDASNSWQDRNTMLEMTKKRVEKEAEILNLHRQFLNLLEKGGATVTESSYSSKTEDKFLLNGDKFSCVWEGGLYKKAYAFDSINWKSYATFKEVPLPTTIVFSPGPNGRQGTIVPIFRLKNEEFTIGWLSRRPSNFSRAARMHSTESKSVIAFYELGSPCHIATLQWDARNEL